MKDHTTGDSGNVIKRLQIFAVVAGFALMLAVPTAHGAVIVTNFATISSNPGDPAITVGDLFETPDGWYYGLFSDLVEGGVLQVAPNGSVQSFYLDVPNELPNWLIQGNDGKIFGTSGGAYSPVQTNYGSVFEFYTNGTASTLAIFNGTNGSTPVPLVQAPDGTLYGATVWGGIGFTNSQTSGYGTIFKIDTNGVLTTLFEFNQTNGASPYTLAIGGDGNLYGMTLNGGSDTNSYFTLLGYYGVGAGTGFKLSPGGTLLGSASMIGTNSGYGVTSMIAGRDGNFYGTARGGGCYGYGTLVELTTNATLNTIASFDNTNGAYPFCLVQTSDGTFYGFTDYGLNQSGALFEASESGVITPLVVMTNTPWGPYGLREMIQGLDGRFYGYQGAQTRWLLQISAPVAPVLQTALPSSSQVNLTWNSVAGQTYQVQSATNPSQTNWTNLGGSITATNGTLSASDSNVSGLTKFYRVVISP